MRDKALWAGAVVFSLPAFLYPIYNPDLFWHLSAGRWIFEHGAVPRADWLSFTMPGAPWKDFEWLAQVLFEAAFRTGGFTALWVFKGVLLAATWAALDAALRTRWAAAPERALGLLLWSTAALMHADIRPELFSLFFFALTLAYLESLNAGRVRLSWTGLVMTACFFAVWADLHLGFVFAFGLFAVYGSVFSLQRRWRPAADCLKLIGAAGLGTLANPYGAGPYEVALSHWRAGAELSRAIAEWQPLSSQRPGFWAFWLLAALALVFVAAELRRREADAPWAAAASALGLACAAVVHSRAAFYFSIPAVFVACAGARRQGAWGRWALRAAAAACAAYAVWLAPRMHWTRLFNERFVPRTAVEFLAQEQAVVEPLRAYNPWEWGGYLGWRLGPWYKVFDDGRYIFHSGLSREARAVAGAKQWQAFMAEQNLDAAWMHNLPMTFETTKAYPDGATKRFLRPYYLYYMPHDRWALVYWDPQALLFVRRDAAPKAWLSEHEYRYVRPGDDAAFAEALARKEIPAAEVAAEKDRHEQELARLRARL